jgi:hypothetical protein
MASASNWRQSREAIHRVFCRDNIGCFHVYCRLREFRKLSISHLRCDC